MSEMKTVMEIDDEHRNRTRAMNEKHNIQQQSYQQTTSTDNRMKSTKNCIKNKKKQIYSHMHHTSITIILFNCEIVFAFCRFQAPNYTYFNFGLHTSTNTNSISLNLFDFVYPFG